MNEFNTISARSHTEVIAVTMDPRLHVAALLLLFCAFAVAASYASRRSIRLDRRPWGALVAALQRVDLDGLQSVAMDYLEPHKGQTVMEPEVIWQLLGGEQGLKHMRANADLLLAIAAHASRWNGEEGTVVAERMRRDAVRLRSAVRRVQMGMLSQIVTGHHWVSVPFQLQEAASSYYLMRQRLVALYESSHVGLLPQLLEAV